MTRIRIACCSPAVKWERMGWQSFIDYANSQNVDVFYLDLTKPIHEQGPMSLIVHKLTYVMKSGNIESDPQVKALSDFGKAHPEIPILDDLDAVAITLDRDRMDAIFRGIHWPDDVPVLIPQSQLLLDSNQDLSRITVNFPVLVKPKVATATPESHQMRLVTSPEQLKGVPTPAMLQEFVNHDGMVFKLYALGDHLEAGVRPSIRNIEPGESIALDFHSQHSEVDNGLWTKPRDLSKVEIPVKKFERVSEILRTALNLNLIGFDILIDQEGRFWLVDLNYFPAYRNVDDQWGKFLAFFLKIINQKAG
jgi:inositol-1,3,4-trisphosphate 5/6-kinase/inositol-tetrakisphosphate 1-kinase